MERAEEVLLLVSRKLDGVLVAMEVFQLSEYVMFRVDTIDVDVISEEDAVTVVVMSTVVVRVTTLKPHSD